MFAARAALRVAPILVLPFIARYDAARLEAEIVLPATRAMAASWVAGRYLIREDESYAAAIVNAEAAGRAASCAANAADTPQLGRSSTGHSARAAAAAAYSVAANTPTRAAAASHSLPLALRSTASLLTPVIGVLTPLLPSRTPTTPMRNSLFNLQTLPRLPRSHYGSHLFRPGHATPGVSWIRSCLRSTRIGQCGSNGMRPGSTAVRRVNHSKLRGSRLQTRLGNTRGRSMRRSRD